MIRFIFKRFGQAVITLLALTVVVFFLARITGDPTDILLPVEATVETRARIAAQWGLDQPTHIQYFRFLTNAIQGNFGESLNWPGRDALQLVLQRLGNTVRLALVALLFAVALAIPIGVLSAVHKDSRLDSFGKTIALLGQSLPHFWIGIVLVWVFGVELRLLPSSGADTWRHYILPAIVIGWFQVAALMRLLRSAMLEALDSEYVQLARVKGVRTRAIVWKHCLRNAAIPPVTYAGIMLGYLTIGSISTEIVFSWPGIGVLVMQSVLARDYPVVQTIAVVFGVVIIAANFVVDILYAYLDPRIRL